MNEPEQEFRRKLSELLRHPPKSIIYASTSGKTQKATDYFKLEAEIVELFQEAGYRLQPAGKAPLLTDKEIMACQGVCAQCDDNTRAVAQAQNDADNKFFEKSPEHFSLIKKDEEAEPSTLAESEFPAWLGEG